MEDTVKTYIVRNILAPFGLLTALLAGCGGGGGSSASPAAGSPTKTAAQLSAEASAALTASTTIAPTMDWSGAAMKSVSTGEVSVVSTTSMGEVSMIVSSVDYIDPTTGLAETSPYRGTPFYDSRVDDPSKTASSIDASKLNARFSLMNVNFRSIESVYVEVFSETKGLVYQEVIATSSIRSGTLVVTVK
jgi:hypothetical protein